MPTQKAAHPKTTNHYQGIGEERWLMVGDALYVGEDWHRGLASVHATRRTP